MNIQFKMQITRVFISFLLPFAWFSTSLQAVSAFSMAKRHNFAYRHKLFHVYSPYYLLKHSYPRLDN